jgi:hypothetical protein
MDGSAAGRWISRRACRGGPVGGRGSAAAEIEAREETGSSSAGARWGPRGSGTPRRPQRRARTSGTAAGAWPPPPPPRTRGTGMGAAAGTTAAAGPRGPDAPPPPTTNGSRWGPDPPPRCSSGTSRAAAAAPVAAPRSRCRARAARPRHRHRRGEGEGQPDPWAGGASGWSSPRPRRWTPSCRGGTGRPGGSGGAPRRRSTRSPPARRLRRGRWRRRGARGGAAPGAPRSGAARRPAVCHHGLQPLHAAQRRDRAQVHALLAVDEDHRQNGGVPHVRRTLLPASAAAERPRVSRDPTTRSLTSGHKHRIETAATRTRSVCLGCCELGIERTGVEAAEGFIERRVGVS